MQTVNITHTILDVFLKALGRQCMDFVFLLQTVHPFIVMFNLYDHEGHDDTLNEATVL